MFVFSLLWMTATATALATSHTPQATFSLEPNSRTVTIGTEFTVDIVLDTDGARTAAIDTSVSFPKNKLELMEIINGDIFDEYVGKVVDNRRGIANLSGLASLGDDISFFSGKAIVASLRFRALSPGKAPIVFTFTPESVNDRNNVSNADTIVDVANPVSTDILSTVSGTLITIPDDGSPTIPATASIWQDSTSCDACGKCLEDSELPPEYASCISCVYQSAGPPPEGLKRSAMWTPEGCQETESEQIRRTYSLFAAIAGIGSYAVMIAGGYMAVTGRTNPKNMRRGKKLIATGGTALLLLVLSSILLQASS